MKKNIPCLLRAASVLAGSICLLTPGVYAQKNSGKVIKSLLTTPKVNTPAARPPLLKASKNVSVSRALRQNWMANWNLALSAQAERQMLSSVTKKRMKMLQAHRQLAGQQQLSPYAQKQTRFLREDLEKNGHIWPSYATGSQNVYMLRRITNFMTVENPDPEVLEVQQEIIRLRAASQALSPEEVLRAAQEFVSNGVVPQQAYVWAREVYTEEELALGEEIAFAIAASKVPMENNPWNIPGMDELADKVNTYNLMRRAIPLFEGIPEYATENGVRQPNIPILTRAEYAEKQLAFANEHPFEYALAPYRSQYFGGVLSNVFNRLSRIEKEALLFTTPGLETATDTKISADWYDEDGLRWDLIHPDRKLRSFLNAEDTANFMERLSDVAAKNYRLSFRTPSGENVAFEELPYENQIEFLRWAWAHHRLVPQAVLPILYK